MKNLKIDVCVCNKCVMNGAMDIIDAVESLKKLKVQLRLNTSIQVATVTGLGGGKHSDTAPVVSINGETIENAHCETVMSRIISLTQKDVKY